MGLAFRFFNRIPLGGGEIASRKELTKGSCWYENDWR